MLPLNSSVKVRGAGARVAVDAGADGITLGVSEGSIVGVLLKVGVRCGGVGIAVVDAQATVIKIKNRNRMLFRIIMPQ